MRKLSALVAVGFLSAGLNSCGSSTQALSGTCVKAITEAVGSVPEPRLLYWNEKDELTMVSPDGQKRASVPLTNSLFTITRNDAGDRFVTQASGCDVDGTVAIDIKEANKSRGFGEDVRYPSVSHSGELVAYVKDQDVYVSNFDGSSERKVAEDGVFAGANRISWSLDDGRLIWGMPGKSLRVVEIESKTDTTWEIPSYGEGPLNTTPNVSGNGTVAYSTYKVDKGRIGITSLDGKEQKSWDIAGHPIWTKWSPDGNLIAFQTDYGRQINEGTACSLSVLDTRTSEIKELLKNSRCSDLFPAHEESWSQDGKWLAVQTLTDANSAVTIVDLNGNASNVVTLPPNHIASPIWLRS